jgi:hypothetical protein
MPVNVDARGYERQLRPEKVDPFASYIYFGEAGLVAVVLIAHREWTSRIAAHQTRAPLARHLLGILQTNFREGRCSRKSARPRSEGPRAGR